MKKWTKMDIFILVLEVASPVVAVIITMIPALKEKLSEDIRLAIIGGGILIPIILLQISVTVGQNKVSEDISRLNKRNDEIINKVNANYQISEKINNIIFDLNKKYNEISKKISYLNPLLDKAFITKNERIKRFVFRRMGEVSTQIRQIQTAFESQNSGDLKPNEYYEELLFLADMIIEDQKLNKKNFKGEIWAMTSFADEEWIENAGYEHLWTLKLKEMVEIGIKTRRICVVPDDVYKLISANRFDIALSEKNNSFKGFISYLKDYFNVLQNSNDIAEHYGIKPCENKELSSIKGFFAIKLTSGELHILHGETVNQSGALTAKVLFDPDEILALRNLFERYTQNTFKLEKFIESARKKNSGFKEYLESQNINIW